MRVSEEKCCGGIAVGRRGDVRMAVGALIYLKLFIHDKNLQIRDKLV